MREEEGREGGPAAGCALVAASRLLPVGLVQRAVFLRGQVRLPVEVWNEVHRVG